MVLSRCWDTWHELLVMVQADTVKHWRREGWQLFWCRPRLCRGRPPLAQETQTLIRWINRDNVSWGAPRIHGELRKLGVAVSRTTIAKYMVRRPGPPSQTWGTFLHNHARALVARGAYTELTSGIHAYLAQLVCSLQRGVGWSIVRALDVAGSSASVPVVPTQARLCSSPQSSQPLAGNASTYERGPPGLQRLSPNASLSAVPLMHADRGEVCLAVSRASGGTRHSSFLQLPKRQDNPGEPSVLSPRAA
jgi:hypothetical protein